MNTTLSTRGAVLLLGLVFSASAVAAAFIESVNGNVRSGISVTDATEARANQRLLPGAFVVTGAKSGAVLRFDDGQAIALGEDTQFKVTAYSFDRESPARDSVVLELFRGALRSITGLLGNRNPQAYTLRIPQATIGIRGTDFMVAVVNPAYVSVINGTITASNAAGAVSYAAGTTGTIAASTVLGVTIPASALPGSVAASFGQLSSLTLAAGAQAAVGAATGGLTAGGVAIGAAIAAGIAAASSDNPSGTTGTGTTSPHF